MKEFRRRDAWLWVLMIAALLLAPGSAARTSAFGTPATSMQVLSDSPEALVIELVLPAYTLRDVALEGGTFVQIDAAGLSKSGQAGFPQLPSYNFLVGLPPSGQPLLLIKRIRQKELGLSHPIRPAPAHVVSDAWTGSGSHQYLDANGADRFSSVRLVSEFALADGVYQRDTFYPDSMVELVDTGWIRDQRVGHIVWHPFRYHPTGAQLQVVERLELEIRFDDGGAGSRIQGQADTMPAAFDRVLDETLVNADTARVWRMAPTSANRLSMATTQLGSHKIVIDAEGLYRITYSALVQADVKVEDLDPRTLQLFEQGQEVAIMMSGSQDGVLDPGDAILFYGRVPESRYTDQNVYWLRYGVEDGLRMGTRNATSGGDTGVTWAKAHYRQNVYYDSRFRAADGDHWYAADVRPGTDAEATIHLPVLDTGVPTTTLQVRMVGYTQRGDVNPDHRAHFSLNGILVGQLEWDGTGPVTEIWELDRSLWTSGENSIVVHLPGVAGAPVEGAWLDSVEVEYPLLSVQGDEVTFRGTEGTKRYTIGGFSVQDLWLLDVTDPQHPEQLLGAQVTGQQSYALAFADSTPVPLTYYAAANDQMREPRSIEMDVPSNLVDSANGADYLIVTHADFAPALPPLVDHRESQGLDVMVVDVQDVYDEFNGGVISPEAIRQFVSYACTDWVRSPTYLLLVGDGSYDLRDYHGYGSQNFVPPYMAMVDPWWGETATDNAYVTVIGDDPLPDLMVGRLPVNTLDEATTVVQKILQYERAPLPGDWNAQQVFVADNADAAGNYAEMYKGVLSQYLESPWIANEIYVGQLSAEAAGIETWSAWQQGAVLFSFAGHSSWHQWAAEALLDIHDVGALENDRRWPVILSMTCFTGYFHHPEYATLDEALLRAEYGGAVATWSPSGLGVATGHEDLYDGFYQMVFADHDARLGQATLAGKVRLYQQAPEYVDLLDTFHLFGDPAMAINLTIRPWASKIYLPVTARNLGG